MSPAEKAGPARKAAAKAPTRKGSAASTPLSAPSIEEAVQKMDLTQVQCRDFGHSWRPFSARWLGEYNSYESQLLCQRCKTVRTRFLGRSGEQLSSSYDYPDGYLVKGMGRLTGHDRDTIRLTSILAVLVEDTAQEA